ncbi:pentatricopeptide repeat-containing protein At2g17033-like isoform X2 [Pistacia vera]|uniref:pentatricopeptide repeat-containing protein At2g17033-like isoform X2 n=1 Tax=Pistacia vera TaxID=55513 RepID=UPI001262E1AE|nr:pentatricopeptide repeat-containing protein At2g17033-like isoform X2 [Pistacia vera]
MGSLHVRIPPPWNHNVRRLHNQEPQQPLCHFPSASLSKQGQRFLRSLVVTRDSKTANRLISKFVASSPQFIALNALSHLLSPHSTHPHHLSSLALPLYLRITEESWFKWNPKLVAELMAMLVKQGKHEETEALMSERVGKLEFRERELVVFYGNLIDSYCKNDLKGEFHEICGLKRHGYKSMVSGLCEMGQPHEAENRVEEMRVEGLKPTGFEFRCLVYGYGRLGLFEEMERCVKKMESEGLEVDTVCSNMVLSSYGACNELSRMVSMLQDLNDFPVSITKLTGSLNGDEVQLVESCVLNEAMEWNSMEVKLDLHGMHLGSAYLIMLQWMEEMRFRFSDGNYAIPAEVTVVCGLGKHSSVRGESPVKAMVKNMVIRTNCPLRIDRNNIGCFVGKGHVVKNWLC